MTLRGHAQEPVNAAEQSQASQSAEAQTSPPPVEAAPTPPKSVTERLTGERRQLLSQLKGPPSPVWLPVGEQKVLAFWQPDQSGKPLGAILMLHAEGQNPRWRSTLLRLHQYLPPFGWATLSLELPNLPDPVMPPRPTPAAIAAQPATPSVDANKPVDETQVVHQEADPPAEPTPTQSTVPQEDVSATIQQRIRAATEYLNEQGQFNVVVLGEGMSAQWALEYLAIAVPPAAPTSADSKRSAVIERAVRAVVLLNPPESTAKTPIKDLLQHPAVPTFDVFTDLNLDAQEAAKARRQQAKLKGYENYVQRRLPPLTGANPEAVETTLTKAIRGFLQKHARGVEFQ